MKKLLLILSCLMLMLLAAGCGGRQAANSNAGKFLRVATDANFPPYEYYQEKSDAHTGFDIDLINALARQMGYDGVHFVNVEFSKILPGLEAKQYDLAIAGITISPERAQRVAFTVPYLDAGFKIIVPQGSAIGDTLDSLQGQRVAVENGSASMVLVQQYGKARAVLPQRSTEAALQCVVEGRADCMVVSKMTGAFFLNTSSRYHSLKFAGDDFLGRADVAIAVHRDNAQLVQALNAALAQYKKSSDYDRLYKTYFGNIN